MRAQAVRTAKTPVYLERIGTGNRICLPVYQQPMLREGWLIYGWSRRKLPNLTDVLGSKHRFRIVLPANRIADERAFLTYPKECRDEELFITDDFREYVSYTLSHFYAGQPGVSVLCLGDKELCLQILGEYPWDCASIKISDSMGNVPVPDFTRTRLKNKI